MLVSITRLRVRQWRFLPSFLFHALRTRRQLKRSVGFLGGAFARELPLVFWTFTVWTDEHAMRAFRNTADHMRAMPHLIRWCNEASYVHWQQGDAFTPTSAVAFARLRDTGKTSKVSHPSAAHAAGRTTADREPKVLGGRFLPRRI